jgi:glyoxylase-like metal-dependent hydrolase (beta-lactamase superfamily II)
VRVDQVAGVESPSRTVKHGDFLVTVVSDGYISVPDDIVAAGAEPDARPALLDRLPAAACGVKAYANIPIVQAGGDLIIFDVGGGAHYQPTEGRLARNMTAAGLDRSAITKVVFTHAHPDHVWGTQNNDGDLLFPNATYYVGKAEWDFWMDPDFLINMPAGLHAFARGTRQALDAVKGRLVFLQPGDDVVTGLRALDTTGHTPGHLSFELAGGDGLLIAADVATSSIVSFEHPEWVFGFDTLPEIAIRTRRSFLDRAATDRPQLLGYHWPYPGLGTAERHQTAYRFCPSTACDTNE